MVGGVRQASGIQAGGCDIAAGVERARLQTSGSVADSPQHEMTLPPDSITASTAMHSGVGMEISVEFSKPVTASPQHCLVSSETL